MLRLLHSGRSHLLRRKVLETLNDKTSPKRDTGHYYMMSIQKQRRNGEGGGMLRPPRAAESNGQHKKKSYRIFKSINNCESFKVRNFCYRRSRY